MMIIYGTIQIIQFFLRSYRYQSGIIYDSEYCQPGTINFYGPGSDEPRRRKLSLLSQINLFLDGRETREHFFGSQC